MGSLRLLVLVGLTCALLVLGAGTAQAAPFTVSSTADEPGAAPGDGACASTPSGACTLRAAIMESNALAGDDAISLPAGTFELTIPPVEGGAPDDEAHEDLDITGSVTITGAGQDQTIVFVTNLPGFFPGVRANVQTFEIHPGATVAMANLTVERGGSSSGTGIQNDGILTLTDVTVKGSMNLGIGNGATGTLNGTLVAQLATTGQDNGLRAVRFDSFTGASVDVGEQTNQSAPFAVSIPPGREPSSLQFTVRRAPGATAGTVRLVVVDGCGEWSTLVGGGASAW